MIVEKKYYPQLDAIRGISVLFVFFFHAIKPIKNGFLPHDMVCFFLSQMGIGLDVFFILSSFLLTLLGITEYKKNGFFSFKKYFIRRALRIWPLYFLFMFLSFFVIANLAKYYGSHITMPPAGWYLLFVSNFYVEGHVFFLRILWTLSVEEQFYIAWGICLLFFQKRLKMIIFFIGAISIVFNLVAAIKNVSIYFNTITYLVDMMAGAYIAYSFVDNNSIIRFVKKINGMISVWFYLFLPLLFVLYYFADSFFDGVANNLLALFVKFIFIAYCSLVVLDQMVNDNRKLNFGNFRFLTYTGKISYGLYCFHGVVITFGALIFSKLPFYISPLLGALLILGITFLIASVSYKFIEKPFLILKSKFV